jgi:peptidoglycan hydrolase-like protein with peptidoglycan-binding domain
MRTTVLQRGHAASDLIVYAHIDGQVLAPLVPKVTDDAVVTLFAGAGTSAYRNKIGAGWRPFVAGLSDVLGHPVHRTLLATWSAGSQVAIEAACDADPPDALVMLDGLYAGKPSGSRMGDGKIVPTAQLHALAAYACRAARGERSPRGEPYRLVLFHSRIPTTYASSKECCEWVQAQVEAAVGPMRPASDVEPHLLDGHFFVEALALGNLRVVEFAGADAAEHIRQAHLWDEAARLWVPWILPGSGASPAPVDPSSPAPVRVLRVTRPMMRGADVRAWQAYLKEQGAELDADGVFGPFTEAKTRWFQVAFNLPATGGLDAATFAAALGAGFLPDVVVAPPATKPPADAPPASIPPTTIAEAVVLRARVDLGVYEDLGQNDGRRIRELGQPWGFKPGQNWCAYAASAWIRWGALDIGVAPPIVGSGGAQAVMAQFKAAGRWLSAAEARKNPALVTAGMVPVWDRSTPGKPETSWQGHIGVTVGGMVGGVFPTIEGNSGVDGRRVAEMQRQLSDGRLFGFGRL